LELQPKENQGFAVIGAANLMERCQSIRRNARQERFVRPLGPKMSDGEKGRL
jgi:hypothetical protein